MNEKSKVEKTSSSLPVNVVANAVGIYGATITPLAAFVPFLVQTLASGRQTQRLEKMFNELSAVIESQSERLQELTDDQYKLVSEAISAAFYTVNEEKIRILKNAVITAIKEPDIADSTSDALSRVMRDISVNEARFVINNFHYSMLFIGSETITLSKSDDGLVITPGSNEETLISGLIALGLIYSKTPVIGAVRFEWSPLVVKVVRLLTVDE
jgi:hypothetical protein